MHSAKYTDGMRQETNVDIFNHFSHEWILREEKNRPKRGRGLHIHDKQHSADDIK